MQFLNSGFMAVDTGIRRDDDFFSEITHDFFFFQTIFFSYYLEGCT